MVLVMALHVAAQDCDRKAQVMALLIHYGIQPNVRDIVLENCG
jgi:hypothetical protein